MQKFIVTIVLPKGHRSPIVIGLSCDQEDGGEPYNKMLF